MSYQNGGSVIRIRGVLQESSPLQLLCLPREGHVSGLSILVIWGTTTPILRLSMTYQDLDVNHRGVEHISEHSSDTVCIPNGTPVIPFIKYKLLTKALWVLF